MKMPIASQIKMIITVVLSIVILTLVACGGQPSQPAGPENPAVAAAREALAAKLAVTPKELTLVFAEEVQWSNTSLGYPEPGKMYAEVITPGYRVLFEYRGHRYEYHTDEDGATVVTCEEKP